MIASAPLWLTGTRVWLLHQSGFLVRKKEHELCHWRRTRKMLEKQLHIATASTIVFTNEKFIG